MRDPRSDPRPGDVLRGKNSMGTTVETRIHFVHSGQVFFGSADSLGGGRMSIENYRIQAKDAEVIHVAE